MNDVSSYMSDVIYLPSECTTENDNLLSDIIDIIENVRMSSRGDNNIRTLGINDVKSYMSDVIYLTDVRMSDRK